MTSIIKFYTLSGALDESPPCYLLQIDEFKFLLDCGWDESFSMGVVNKLKRYIHQIDAVLLSHPDRYHLGILPYLVGKCGLNCPVYATIPVYQMGQMFMYDLHESLCNVEDFNLFNLDDVDAAFDKVIQVKYNQIVSLKGKGIGLRIVAMPAGHMVGGTIWRISKVDEEDIVYAVDFNHKNERHLNGSDLLRKLGTPSLLILDCFNGAYAQPRRRSRDEALITSLLTTLRVKGNVLVPIDTAGRVLELIYMLDQMWHNEESGLGVYSIVFLTNVSYNTVEFAKSQIEWMSDKLMKSFEGARNNPFFFKHVKLCHNMNDFNKVSEPKVVLASNGDLESGFSREVFIMWASNPKNSIILVDRTAPGTLARDLIDNGGDRYIKLTVKKRVPLDGNELDEYNFKQNAEKMEASKIDPESPDSGDEQETIRGKHELLEDDDSSSLEKSPRKELPLMFPYYEEKLKFDSYGVTIKLEDFIKFKTTSGDTLTVDEQNKLSDEEEEDLCDIPSKCVEFKQDIHVAAKIVQIDFEGRSDGETLKRVVFTLKPRRLILIRGNPYSTEVVYNFAKVFTDGKVFTPRIGRCLNVTSESHIYQVRLTDSFLSTINLKKGPNCDLAYINAKLKLKSRDGTMEIDNVEPKKMPKLDDKLFTLEPLSENEIPPHKTVFINRLKMSHFKQVLSKNNVPCELSEGVLWCYDRTVCVRRNDSGKVLLEGVISRQYYYIRSLLYSQFIII